MSATSFDTSVSSSGFTPIFFDNHALTSEQVKTITFDLDGLAADYQDVTEDLTTSIEQVSAGGMRNAVSTCKSAYNIAGQRIVNETRGISIVKMANGTYRKIIKH